MNLSAIIMLIFGVLFLYGGITYFIIIALRSKEDAAYSGQQGRSDENKSE